MKYCWILVTDRLPAHRPPQLSLYRNGGALIPNGRVSVLVQDQGTLKCLDFAHRCSRVMQ